MAAAFSPEKDFETAPAVAAGLEEKPWSLEKVVEMSETYWLRNEVNREYCF